MEGATGNEAMMVSTGTSSETRGMAVTSALDAVAQSDNTALKAKIFPKDISNTQPNYPS